MNLVLVATAILICKTDLTDIFGKSGMIKKPIKESTSKYHQQWVHSRNVSISSGVSMSDKKNSSIYIRKFHQFPPLIPWATSTE